MTDDAPKTIEINDAVFCTHFKEVCTDCEADLREENDGFFGFDFIDREGIEAPTSSQNKDGVYQCKKHGASSTSPPSQLSLRFCPLVDPLSCFACSDKKIRNSSPRFFKSYRYLYLFSSVVDYI
ncbi:hypothetical protein EI94DRAFT_1746766 [Lactarius quietus]|nr:hypothetical protein EI94DRAFT_1746766 [Lactarius quietus]